MARDRVQMPASTAGLTRYFEDYKSKIELKPGHIIIFAVIVVLIIVALHLLGSSLMA